MGHPARGGSRLWNRVAFLLPPLILAVVIVGQRLRRDHATARRAMWTGAVALTALWLLAQLLAFHN